MGYMTMSRSLQKLVRRLQGFVTGDTGPWQGDYRTFSGGLQDLVRGSTGPCQGVYMTLSRGLQDLVLGLL